MKTKLPLLILIIFTKLAFAQTTYVPDDTFEARLIYLGYDDVLDDYVLTANINTVTQFLTDSANISDYTGIEDFTALSVFTCRNNAITTLDLSQNLNLTYFACTNSQMNGTLDLSQNINLIDLQCPTNSIDQLLLPPTTTLKFLTIHDNEITALDVTQNPSLIFLRAKHNLFDGTLDLSQNTALYDIEVDYSNIDTLLLPPTTALTELSCRGNQLTTLDVSFNTALKDLLCSDNQIISIDLTLNTALETLHVNLNLFTNLDLSLNSNLKSLNASNNNLNYASIKNGNNTNFTSAPGFQNNPQLTCVEVDDAVFSTNNWTSFNTPLAYFSEDCNLNVNTFNEASVSLFPNPAMDKLFLSFKTEENVSYQLINLNGKIILKGEFTEQNNSIDLAEISAGVYFLRLESTNRITVKKLIKQ